MGTTSTTKPSISRTCPIGQNTRFARGKASVACGASFALAVTAWLTHGALAQSPPPLNQPANPTGGVVSLATPEAVPTTLTDAISTNPYSNYQWKGLNIKLPLPALTVDGDLGGLRQELADDYGIGYIGFASAAFYDNALHAGHSLGGSQAYLGQRPTLNSVNFATVTLDLSRHGVPNGQLALSVNYNANTWNPVGPKALVPNFSYYQTLANNRFEIKLGLMNNTFEFVGQTIAGSVSGGVFGPSGNLLVETGLSAGIYPTYGINVKTHITNHIYDKVGVARPLNPDGVLVEHERNPQGVDFTTPNTGGYVINEIGYLRQAGPGSPQTWLRLDTEFNDDRYLELDHPGHRGGKNFGAFLLADRQIWQSSSAKGESYRGLYIGGSAEYVPPNYNKFSQYYEGRIYGLGILPHRPFDQTSLTITETVFSDVAVAAARAAGRPAHSETTSITASYSASLLPGLYGNIATSYVTHPTPIIYAANTGSDLNLITGLAFFF